MAVDPISAALEAAHQKLSDLLSERATIDKEIVDWKRVIDSLLAVSESEDTDPAVVEVSAFVEGKPGKQTVKFTDGVRMVLQQNSNREIPISVPEIRDQLTNLGFDFAKYAQPLVPIHNTMKRLEEQGEVRPLKNEMGQTLGYKWISPIERALSDDDQLSYLAATGEGIIQAGRIFSSSTTLGTLRAAARRRAATLPIKKRRQEAIAAIDATMKELRDSIKENE